MKMQSSLMQLQKVHLVQRVAADFRLGRRYRVSRTNIRRNRKFENKDGPERQPEGELTGVRGLVPVTLTTPCSCIFRLQGGGSIWWLQHENTTQNAPKLTILTPKYQNFSGEKAPSPRTYPECVTPSPHCGLRPLDPLLLSDNSHPGISQYYGWQLDIMAACHKIVDYVL